MSNVGKMVQVHYIGSLDDGTVFDSSYDRGWPMAYKCKTGVMIRGFDNVVANMEVGETVKVRLEPKDAYGERIEALVQTLPLEMAKDPSMLKAGETVTIPSKWGAPFEATIKEINESGIVVDRNHELAGKYLNFEITLVSAE